MNNAAATTKSAATGTHNADGTVTVAFEGTSQTVKGAAAAKPFMMVFRDQGSTWSVAASVHPMKPSPGGNGFEVTFS